jgi:anti-sigma B factor antagonist
MGLQLLVRRVGDVAILDLQGKATIGRATDLLGDHLRQLVDAGSSKILVNLGDVSQLDSSSISTIVRTYVTLKRRGASLKLLRPRGQVKLVLETLHLTDALPVFEDESQAIASFN